MTEEASVWQAWCPNCGMRTQYRPEQWRCRCGGAWEFTDLPPFDPAEFDVSVKTVWRYGRTWPEIPHPHSLGAGGTPLTDAVIQGQSVKLKAEYISPTGSYKDRGSDVMVSFAVAQCSEEIAEDSSGNAGASIAGYAAAAGIKAHIFVPSSASPAKLAQIRAYGAEIHYVDGPRVNARDAAFAFVERGHVFASHAYHPAFLLGLTTLAFEIWEQLNRKSPDWMVMPIGQGVHFLGAWLGFRRLFEAGLIDRMPRMVGVQPELLDPVKRAFDKGLQTVPAMEPKGKSLAEGLAITQPVRGSRILQALRETNGAIVSVSEDEIRTGHAVLAAQGYYVEPSSAVVAAAVPTLKERINAGETVVLPLTGSGLKSPLY